MEYTFRQRNHNGRTEVYDPVRKRWLLMTPEERVRQIFILYLLNVKQFPISHLSVEKAITVNGLTKRYDIVVFGQDQKPYLVVECKAPEVEITQAVLEQAGRYNSTLHAPYLGVTNGHTQYFFSINFETGEITPVDLESV